MLDPLNVRAWLQRFAEPSEVAASWSNCAGVVFHATVSSIQSASHVA